MVTVMTLEVAKTIKVREAFSPKVPREAIRATSQGVRSNLSEKSQQDRRRSLHVGDVAVNISLSVWLLKGFVSNVDSQDILLRSVL